MKKIIALALALLMLLGCVPAMAADVIEPKAKLEDMEKLGEKTAWSDPETGEVVYYRVVTEDQRLWAYYDADGDLTDYEYYSEDFSKSVTYDPAGNTLGSYYYGDGDSFYMYTEEDGWMKWDDEAGDLMACDAPEGVNFKDMPALIKIRQLYKGPVEWYAKNTQSLIGLSLKELGVGNKWYNVVPVDLTKDGVQTFPMAVSGMFFLGETTVTVKDGAVTVNYEIPQGNGYHGYVKSECVKWFTDLGDITEDFVNNPSSETAFGQAVSIADELGGADTALLFICNRITYRQPYTNYGDFLVRYYANKPEWKDYRANLTVLLEKMEAAEETEEATSTDIADATTTDLVEETAPATATDTDA